MIGYRNGVALTFCDGCFRPRRFSEDGWTSGERMAPYRSPDDVALDRPAAGSRRVPADWCPECAPAVDDA